MIDLAVDGAGNVTVSEWIVHTVRPEISNTGFRSRWIAGRYVAEKAAHVLASPHIGNGVMLVRRDA